MEPHPSHRDQPLVGERLLRWRRRVAVLLLAICAGLTFSASLRTSVAVDEFAHLPLGLMAWQDPSASGLLGVAPLPDLLAALPVLMAGPEGTGQKPWTGNAAWEAGYRFACANAGRYHTYFMLARSVTLLVLLAVCLLAMGLASSLYGPAGGLIALAVACLTPDLLAHGGLVGTDIWLAGGIMASLWALDALLRSPGWRSGLLLGTSIGATALCKFTALLLLLLIPLSIGVVWLVERTRAGRGTAPRCVRRGTALWCGVALVAALLIINLSYGSRDSLKPLGEYPFQTEALRALQQRLPAWLPVPLPGPYMLGIDAQMFGEEGPFSYLLGRFSPDGFWNYYLVGLLVKTPEPILLLAALATLCLRRVMVREIPLLLVAVAGLLFFSFVGVKNIGVRYVLFLLPIAAVWIGRCAVAPAWAGRRSARLMGVGVAASLAALLAITLSAWPHYLAYFNAASGGPERGHRYLLDSNLDWGQDLITLRGYLQRQGIDSVDLAYFGRVDPVIYGITYRPLIGEVRQRYVVVSANLLWGRMYFLGGTDFWPRNPDYFAAFRPLAPKAVLGASLYVFDTQGLPPIVLR